MPRWGKEWTENDVKAYLQRFKGQDHSSVRLADPQPDPGSQVSRPLEGQEIHPRYHIRIHSLRRRSTDTDAIDCKSTIDGLVRGGLLPDDSAEWVESIEVTESKHRGTEATIIEIYEIKKGEE